MATPPRQPRPGADRPGAPAPPTTGLPGGILLPAAVLAGSLTAFVVLFRDPDLVDLGGRASPAGIAVLTAVAAASWLLLAIGRRQPKG